MPIRSLRLVGAIAVSLFVLGASPAAADYTVTGTGDAGDATPDGVCDQGAGGACNLREAIQESNSGVSADTIVFAPGVTGQVNLTAPLPGLVTEMSIVGPGASALTVRRNTGGDYRIFDISNPGTPVSISGLTVSNGRVVGGLSGVGGGILVDNDASLVLRDAVVSGNSVGVDASGTVAFASGGGIYAAGDLTVERSVISNNVITADVTTPGSEARAIGAGLSLRSGAVSVSSTTISGNTATGTNAGANQTKLAATGGGIQISEFYNGPGITIENSTISGNTVSGSIPASSDHDRGGGINDESGSALRHLTIAGNASSDGANLSGMFLTTTIENSIVADAPAGEDNCALSPNSLGHNLKDDGTCFGEATDVNADPGLQPLASNGGPTPTHAILQSSPAVDKGTAAGATADQRGLSRPADFASIANASPGDGSDIGAFELRVPPVTQPPAEPPKPPKPPSGKPKPRHKPKPRRHCKRDRSSYHGGGKKHCRKRHGRH